MDHQDSFYARLAPRMIALVKFWDLVGDNDTPAFGGVKIDSVLEWMVGAEIGVLNGHSAGVTEVVQKWAEKTPEFGFDTDLISREELAEALINGGAGDIISLINRRSDERATYACAWGALTAAQRILQIDDDEIIAE